MRLTIRSAILMLSPPTARLSVAVDYRPVWGETAWPQGRRPTLTRDCRAPAGTSYPLRVFSGMPDPNTDGMQSRSKNLTTGETVILTAVDMTENEKDVVVRQLLRLSGAPAALWIEDDEPKKPF